MIPSTAILATNLEQADISSNTHRIAYDIDRVLGYANDLEAVKQSIYLILNTERYMFPIYGWDYGIELRDLIGMNTTLVVPELKRRITEALMRDERITSVGDFNFTINKNKVKVDFTVTTIYGNTSNMLEVSI